MVKAVDIKEVLSTLTHFEGRQPDTPSDDIEPAFATLSDYRDGGIFAGGFTGKSPWERHDQGDEIVHILDGETSLFVKTSDGVTHELVLGAGQLAVVPQGCWHRFEAPTGVTLMTVTPQPTIHTTDADPK